MPKQRNLSGAKVGMVRDKASFDLENSEYTFALNANFHDEHGSGPINVQNEPSNIYCSGFKRGFKVIGHKFDINADRTYFFLVNPVTGCSEIGYINSFYNLDGLEQVERDCDCNLQVILESPLEDVVQVAVCQYKTLLNDCDCEGTPGNQCLNFSIDYPIFESNIQLKDEFSGRVIYFTDGFNPPRYIQLDRLEIYTQDEDPCTGEITPVCLDCDKMRIFKVYDKPCLHVDILQNGGNLKAGLYEAAISYCTQDGVEISPYYSMTNPIPIFDENNTILDQTDLDYVTPYAIKLKATSLDTQYEYFKVAIVYRSGLDASTTIVINGIYPITTEYISVYNLTDKTTITLPELVGGKIFYETSRGMASGNGYLFQYGLKAHREINLQPIVNLLGSFVKWSTVMAEEDIYKDGALVSNYTGYMRDEVYPLAIKFFLDGGYETPAFPFIPRPPFDSEIDELNDEYPSDTNNESVLEYNPDCTGNERNKRWQFENTAQILGDCLVPENPAYGEVVVIETETNSCFFDIGVTINGPDTVIIPNGQDLVTYINSNQAEIIASTDPDWSAIAGVIDDPTDYPGDCVASFGDTCTINPIPISEQIVAISVGSESTEEVALTGFTDYTRVNPPGLASIIDLEGGTATQDATFMATYMRPWEIVNFRANYSNTSCNTADLTVQYINPPSTINNPTWVDYAGSLGTNASLLTGITVSVDDPPNGFTSNLHSNARWYRIDFPSSIDTQIIELSVNAVIASDDICQESLRVTFYDGCPTTTDVPGYGVIISDITLANDTDKFVVLNSVDFPSGTAYIAIDTPIRVDIEWDLTFIGTSGSVDIDIDGTTYTQAFTGSLSGTATNFIATHTTPTILNAVSYDILNGSNNIYVIASGPTLTFRSTEDEYNSLAVTNVSGDLNATDTLVESYYTLTTICGCVNLFNRELITSIETTFTDLVFYKKQIYEADCEYTRPELNGCNPIPHEYGYFSYWESTERYPCNDELYDSSSSVCIELADLQTFLTPAEVDEFLDFYIEGGSASPVIDAVVGSPCFGKLKWKEDLSGKPLVDFRDREIRHYKFPCSINVPFMSPRSENPGDFKSSIIYPIGFSITNEAIKTFLDIAVTNGLITLEERLKINKYEIFRGDRSVDRSIIAKGLLFDMYSYLDGNKETGYSSPSQFIYYPNYPLNALGEDIYNRTNHIYDSIENSLFTFHSPDIHFYKPFLPRELKIEGYQFGKSQTTFDIVRDHSTYVILGKAAYNLATTLATLEVTLDIALKAGELLFQANAAGQVVLIPINYAVWITLSLLLISSLYRIQEIRYRWLETFSNLGHLHQFAYYSATIGHYNNFLPNTASDDFLRGIKTIKYLKDGRYSIPSEDATAPAILINNFQREDSVFLNLKSYPFSYPTQYSNYDTSANLDTCSRRFYDGVGKSPLLIGNAASPYGSLKQYLPSQYGSIQSIDWVHTNFCGDLNEIVDCDPIFGGDVNISRFSVKRKIPFFTVNSHGLAPRTPFQYSNYFNINPSVIANRYYVDYLINEDETIFGITFPTAYKSDFYLYPSGSGGLFTFYVKPPEKFFLFSYGFPYFLTESTINSNFRYAKRQAFEDFYPNTPDVIEFTQETNVSIRELNYYFYNFVYSLLHTTYRRSMLPDNYDSVLYAGTENQENTVIYSLQDGSETSLTDPWILYNGLDTYTFPKTFGKLITMDSIESEQILGRFENGFTMFGAVDQIADRFTSDTANLGKGGIFAGRSVNFNKTDLGYGGTQHSSKVSCEFGHFWVDAKRGQVLQVEPGGASFYEITVGLEKWFRENLPFKITQYIPEIEQRVLDNAFKGLGITMGWDARLKRIFLTKLDYKVLVDDVEYIDNNFYIRTGERLTKVEFTDTEVFEDCSFTIAYSPLSKSWISYYSFKPNYYIAYNNYFQTGVNYSVDVTEEGLWSHLPFLSSYQVFYGNLHPFIIEAIAPTKGYNSVLHNIEYWLDVRKYYNKYDFADIFGYGFNKAYIYNNNQNTGRLNLIHQKNDDLSQSLQYPVHNVNSTDILQSEISGKWSFNYLYNLVKNERSGLPIWRYDCNQIFKTLDDRLLDYRNNYKDRMRGEYFLVRLEQDIESRYKMIYRFQSDMRNYYEQ
jgi:hypothetical protein